MTAGLKIASFLTMAFPGRECVLPEEELKRRGTEEDLGEGRGNVLGQNLKNGGGRRRVGGRRAEAEEGMGEVTGGEEFPSYTPPSRTCSGRDPGELHCNLSTNIINSITDNNINVLARSSGHLCHHLHSSLPCISLHSFFPTFLPQFSFVALLFTMCFILQILTLPLPSGPTR